MTNFFLENQLKVCQQDLSIIIFDQSDKLEMKAMIIVISANEKSDFLCELNDSDKWEDYVYNHNDKGII